MLAKLVHMLQALVLMIIVVVALLYLFWAIRQALGEARRDASIKVPCFCTELPETGTQVCFCQTDGP
jgi:hypothetical protein